MSNIENYKKKLESTFKNEEDFFRVELSYIYNFYKKVEKLILFDYYKFEETLNYDVLFAEVLFLFESIIKKYNHKTLEDTFLSSIVNIRELLDSSLEATYNGDPAANSFAEIVHSYPGFKAIVAYRIAHFFYESGLLSVGRIISEYAHEKTGIDINAGAKIGKGFFIDHGTGIVIGETAIIGDNVKLYQGVTLGALSLKDGHALKDTKRHPTILNNVTIYSNASIFGGNTVIGNNCTIGANIYLTSSLEDNTTIYLSETGIKKIKKD